MPGAGDMPPVVLIVEDEPLVLEIAAEEFTEAGYVVETATDDQAALAILASDRRIDLLFTDIRIPTSIDGWEIAERARRSRPSLHVIYATGFSAEEVRMVERSRFFKKPYRPSAIVAAARELGVCAAGTIS